MSEVAEWPPVGGAMVAGVRQVTELLGGNRRSVGCHVGTTWPLR
jgi:hypothetical protein